MYTCFIFQNAENAYATIAECVPPPTSGAEHPPQQRKGAHRRSERWLKTQSAFLPSSNRVTRSPLEHQAPLELIENKDEKIAPSLPPKLGRGGGVGGVDSGDNQRRLHAMNVTIRRASEEEGGGEGTDSNAKLSKEALLLRSGVTLRPGVRLPRCPSAGDEGGERERGGGSGSWPSGSDEEDGLEPVSRYILL